MKRTDVTYGQLDHVLRALGFTWRPGTNDPPGRIYEHPNVGAIIMLPAFRDSVKVYEHQTVSAGLMVNFRKRHKPEALAKDRRTLR